ncbi:hypothetical protein F8S13_19170 [Chloroflexia bacterium SDU3-3]|nr:hypothetical protein F8S13_19170 [Chloroflexia bacterium SDU3-3]
MAQNDKRKGGEPSVDTSNLSEQLEKQIGSEQKHQSHKGGLNEVDKRFNNRSSRSSIEGGQNEQQGEPTPGYSTEAPGHQNGGKR